MSTERTKLFEAWAARYDASVQGANAEGRFPFGEHARVLDTVVERLGEVRGVHVLELGAGTGHLTSRLLAAGARVTAVDASRNMLDLARARAPGASFVRADVTAPEWLDPFTDLHRNGALDRIGEPGPIRAVAMSFLLHELPLARQVDLVRGVLERAPGVRVVAAGDVGFPDAAGWVAGRLRWSRLWDPDEHYWSAPSVRDAFEEAGLRTDWVQLGDHNAVLTLSRR